MLFSEVPVETRNYKCTTCEPRTYRSSSSLFICPNKQSPAPHFIQTCELRYLTTPQNPILSQLLIAAVSLSCIASTSEKKIFVNRTPLSVSAKGAELITLLSYSVRMSSQPEPHHVPADQPSNPSVSAQDINQYFSPYQRVSPPWDIYERVKTLLVAIFILPFRLLYLGIGILIMLLIASLANIGLQPSRSSETPPKSEQNPGLDYDEDSLFRPPPAWRKFLLSLMYPVARSVLFISFGVFHIKTDKRSFSKKSPNTPPSANAYVTVANHLGYIDILVLFCKFHGSFVAKGELENTPVVGKLARALQCMFVRKGQSLTTQLINRVQSTYQCHVLRETCTGCPACQSKLVIFPEGTTTNGTAMVPFRTGVFNAGVPVKPICIRFPYSHFNLSWETIRFREHVFRTMTQLVNYVHISELPVYNPSTEEMMDARLYASNVQEEMSIVLEQPVELLNRKHKFLYHSYLLGKEEGEQETLRKAEELFKADDQLMYISEKDPEEAV